MKEMIEVKSKKSRSDLYVPLSFAFVDKYAKKIGFEALGWLVVLETLMDRRGDNNIRHYSIRYLKKRYGMGYASIKKCNDILVDHGLLQIKPGDRNNKNIYFLLEAPNVPDSRRAEYIVSHKFGFIDLYAPYIGVKGLGWLTVLNTLMDRTGDIHYIRDYSIQELAGMYNKGHKTIQRLNNILVNHGLLKVEKGSSNKANNYYVLKPVKTKEELFSILENKAVPETTTSRMVKTGTPRMVESGTPRKVKLGTRNMVESGTRAWSNRVHSNNKYNNKYNNKWRTISQANSDNQGSDAPTNSVSGVVVAETKKDSVSRDTDVSGQKELTKESVLSALERLQVKPNVARELVNKYDLSKIMYWVKYAENHKPANLRPGCVVAALKWGWVMPEQREKEIQEQRRRENQELLNRLYKDKETVAPKSVALGELEKARKMLGGN